ncbi:diguanylate cyclase [Mycobacterium triplex]|uniref:Diguanylate cyclase n=1 Tax=Mycobacterium triplex TaxID=47839 RepID=A0A024JX80_9MYCO|nr:GGDEF domain-containing protein [Mycobacterium triplex]ORX01002.1 diguanylate cyclase [Mycobacterium triplex]CDO87853.1 diguanylate cyclase [Mycobacterium triplex]
MGWLAAWWRQPDHFNWLTGYLQSRGLGMSLRWIFAGVSASLALTPIDVLWSPAPYRPSALLLDVVIAVLGLGIAAMWLSGWPTRRQSVFIAMTWSLCFAAGSLAQPNPLLALMGCVALALPGGYFAFFHTAGYMAVNFWLAGTVGAIEVVRMAAAGQGVLAIHCYFLVLELNVLVPFAIQVVVRALTVDLLRTDRDPLTGLFNRRACERAVLGRILTNADHAYLAVAMVDLDRFKNINDTQGHAAGDAALVMVAHALTAACKHTALIGRVGGEEFLVADTVHTERPPAWGSRLCEAVAATPLPVTASVGIATLALSGVGSNDAEEAYRQVVARADAAMYEAKKLGGNQARHHSHQQS